MEVYTEYATVNPAFSIIINLAGIASLVALWKIFEDRGQAGWKALIPYYASLTFGRCCGEEERGKKLVITELALTATMLAFIFSFFWLLMQTSPGGNSNQPVATAIFGISMLLLLVLGIVWFVISVKIKWSYSVLEEEKTWTVLLWALIPVAGNIYYAFLGNKARGNAPTENLQ